MTLRAALILVLIPFTLLSAVALWEYGYLGIVMPHFQAWSALLSTVALWEYGYLGIVVPHIQAWNAGQVFADLAIALGLIMIWMYQDARRLGRNPWPWIVATGAAGSFGPLLYLLTRRDFQLPE